MPDVISPTDRAIIDAAIAAGRVRHIPRGVAGEAVMLYGGRHKSGSYGASPGRRVQKKADGAERKSRVAALWNAGHKPKAIAAAMELPPALVYAELRGLQALGMIAARGEG